MGVRGVSKYYWLAVTPDEFELPLAVADSARELGEICGISGDTVECSAWRGSDGTNSGRKFVKVLRK